MSAVLFWCAAVLSLVFALNLAGRFRKTHAPVYGWWTVSLGLYLIAFIVEALSVASNWHGVWQYQLYIVASAGLVGAMSVGTTHLALPGSKVARGYGAYVTLVGLGLILSTIVHPPVLHGTWAALNGGKQAIVGTTQVAYLLLSAVGGPIVVVGAVWSWWKTRRYYALLIGVGALIPSSAGTMASQGLGLAWFPIMNMVGLVLIFLGYIYSRPRYRSDAPVRSADSGDVIPLKATKNKRTAG